VFEKTYSILHRGVKWLTPYFILHRGVKWLPNRTKERPASVSIFGAAKVYIS
jgi:hypothetical protein